MAALLRTRNAVYRVAFGLSMAGGLEGATHCPGCPRPATPHALIFQRAGDRRRLAAAVAAAGTYGLGDWRYLAVALVTLSWDGRGAAGLAGRVSARRGQLTLLAVLNFWANLGTIWRPSARAQDDPLRSRWPTR
ncbi:MAG: hypothetical protein H6644_20810 [Caldilineaceae bacterium]|nr:hypothetical protein [Caldilineaceae bacterium]